MASIHSMPQGMPTKVQRITQLAQEILNAIHDNKVTPRLVALDIPFSVLVNSSSSIVLRVNMGRDYDYTISLELSQALSDINENISISIKADVKLVNIPDIAKAVKERLQLITDKDKDIDIQYHDSRIWISLSVMQYAIASVFAAVYEIICLACIDIVINDPYDHALDTPCTINSRVLSLFMNRLKDSESFNGAKVQVCGNHLLIIYDSGYSMLCTIVSEPFTLKGLKVQLLPTWVSSDRLRAMSELLELFESNEPAINVKGYVDFGMQSINFKTDYKYALVQVIEKMCNHVHIEANKAKGSVVQF